MKRKLISIGVFFVMSLAMLSGCSHDYGTFYTLQEAYDQGLLTQEELKSIAFYHNVISGGEDLVPIPKNPETLSKETERSIKKAYISRYLANTKEAKISGINIHKYYGTYNNVVAVVISSIYAYNTTDVVDEWREVGDVRFYYGNHDIIFIWEKGDKK